MLVLNSNSCHHHKSVLHVLAKLHTSNSISDSAREATIRQCAKKHYADLIDVLTCECCSRIMVYFTGWV